MHTGTKSLNDVLITGATGLVGRQILPRFERAVITTRNATSARNKFPHDNVSIIQWNYDNEDLNLTNVAAPNAIINLMGESVAEGRWTTAKKKRMYDSRVIATEKLVQSIGNMETKPEVMVSTSAVGYYGDHGDNPITEHVSNGSGFLAELCVDWEAAAREVEKFGVRLVVIRIGIVLSTEGGALAALLPIFKLGGGGQLGSGQQFFPWIHIDDLVNLICWAVRSPDASGVYNATAPHPVTNKEFTKSLAAAIHRPAFLPVPKFALRLLKGEFAESLFESQNVVPSRALEQGFDFKFPRLDAAFANLFSE